MSSSGNSGAVYGGDEINAIVLDAGSYTTRIGYAGDDYPKVIVPSCYAKTANNSKIFGHGMEYPRSNQEIIPIMKESLIQDWDGAIEQYRHYFNELLKVDYQEQPILITEPVWTDKEYRQKLVETFYESFNFPALYLARTPTCVSFQQGRSSCLVVDIGHDSVSVTPVVDGICLLRNSMKTHYSGQFLNDHIHNILKSKYPDVNMELKYRIKEKTPTVYPDAAKFTKREIPDKITTSFDDFQREKIYAEFKELMLEVPEKKMNSSNAQNAESIKEQYDDESEKRLFELPSGQSIEMGIDRFRLADTLFDPASYPFEDESLNEKYPANNGELDISSPYDDYRPLKRARKAGSSPSTPTPAPENGTTTKTARGLSQLITHAISSIDIDLRTSIAHNIIVTGGSSLIPRLTERLYNELSNSNPGLKIRLHALGNANERPNQAWIGGSVLASLGTFHQMWVSKAEYEEAGVDRILTQRFR
ncbi:Actin-related protein 4 [Candidozyma auris]|uniref:Actin-related protein 4 n=2 Tax=Candidozyma auris TaxID=498019 RepID=A0A2H0ZRV8_CANAR|nr:hypothetical_protein [[Candida] auris]KND98128.2 hypothetical protein QG37_05112 [[Candida] auris]PIS51407.1 hypothetical protein B9J08_002988 [[Candida] auris]PIS53391.1 hypothetical protein CJI97_003059 [[Candida] auris]QEO20028.1 hypothetical_protein [[Candida] auris]QWW22208.1 hypothetical protein CA7LBN_000954 [[Candida] auris]